MLRQTRERKKGLPATVTVALHHVRQLREHLVRCSGCVMLIYDANVVCACVTPRGASLLVIVNLLHGHTFGGGMVVLFHTHTHTHVPVCLYDYLTRSTMPPRTKLDHRNHRTARRDPETATHDGQQPTARHVATFTTVSVAVSGAM